MTLKHWKIGLVALLTVLAGSALVVRAADDPAPVGQLTFEPLFTSAPAAAGDSDEWRFAIPIGYFGFDMDGEVALGELTREIDLSSEDVSDKIDTAAGLAFEFGKGKWTGITSLTYIKFEGDKKYGDLPDDGGRYSAEGSLEWTTFQAAAAYRAVMNNPGPKVFIFEPVFGMRYTQLTGSLDVYTEEQDYSAEKDVTWEDLFVGFRLHKSFTERFGMNLSGDYGMGVSGNDQPTWNAAFSLGYKIPFDTWALTLVAGYKTETVEYEDEGDNLFRMDVTMQGPTIGAVFSW